MKLEVYLHRVVPILAILAALGPSATVGKLIKASEFTKSFAQYGPLPDVELLMIDYVTIVFAAGLFVAAVLEAFRFRIAAPAVLVAVTVLWIHYVPSIADEITGTMWFAHQTAPLDWVDLAIADVSDRDHARFRGLDLSAIHSLASIRLAEVYYARTLSSVPPR